MCVCLLSLSRNIEPACNEGRSRDRHHRVTMCATCDVLTGNLTRYIFHLEASFFHLFVTTMSFQGNMTVHYMHRTHCSPCTRVVKFEVLSKQNTKTKGSYKRVNTKTKGCIHVFVVSFAIQGYRAGVLCQ